MTETILRDGEVAFTSNGDVIMNVNTLLELKAKLETSEIPTEQTNEEAMENVCDFLVAVFGPDILDKKPASESAGKPDPVPARDLKKEKEDTHPTRSEPFYFPNKVLIGDNPSSKNAYENSPYVYIDNYGNIFGTMSECDYLHGLSEGSTSKILTGRQIVGYANGYRKWICTLGTSAMNMKLVDFRDSSKYNTPAALLPTDKDIELFNRKHLVNVVKVAKNDIFPNTDVPEKLRTDRKTRYYNYKSAVTKANIEMKDRLKNSYKSIMTAWGVDWEFRKLIDKELNINL